MQNLQGLLSSELGIPAWQLLLFVGLITVFALTHRIKIGLIGIYLLAVYWFFYVFRANLYSVASGDFVAVTAYVLFGFLLVGLALHTFFVFGENNQLPGFTGFEITRLRRTLLKRMERMEKAVLEAEAKAVGELQQFAVLRERVEERVAPLEQQLQRIEGAFGGRGSMLKELEDRLTARIRELEDQLREKERFLNLRDSELEGIKSEAAAKVAGLEAQLREAMGDMGKQESAFGQTRIELTGRVEELERQLEEKEKLLQRKEREIEDLSSNAQARVVSMESRFGELAEAAAKKESSFKEIQESLTARIRDLENELEEKGRFTQLPPPEDKNGGWESEGKVVALEALLREQEQSFSRRTASFKEVMESLTDRIHQLERQLKERGELLETR